MKQIKKDKLCYYCLGCKKQEINGFKPVMRCNNFIPDRKKWREELTEAMKGEQKKK